MTTSPATETSDCIDVIDVDPTGSAVGDRAAEIDAVMSLLETFAGQDTESLGVITPFRQHAIDLEHRVTARFDAETIRRLRLKVGTVHGFQGAERDVVIIAPGLTVHDPAGRRRFVEDPHLFNVMVTRARRRSIVVSALGDRDPGLLDDYIRYGDEGPTLAPARRSDEGWTRALDDRLTGAGLTVRSNYAVGPWVLDLVVGAPDRFVGIETSVHPSGAEAHHERHLTLCNLGWTVTDAFSTRWEGDPARATVDLIGDLQDLGIDPVR